MAHRITEIDIYDLPSMALKLMDDNPSEILFVYGIVGTQGGSVIVEHHCLVLVELVVRTEIIYECRQLTLELHVEGFEHVQSSARRLTCDNPVDVRVIVHADADGSMRIEVFVRPTIQLRVKSED